MAAVVLSLKRLAQIISVEMDFFFNFHYFIWLILSDLYACNLRSMFTPLEL